MRFARLAWFLSIFCSMVLLLLALDGRALMRPPRADLFAPRELDHGGDREFFERRNVIQLKIHQETRVQDLVNMYQLQEHNLSEIERHAVERSGQRVIPAETVLELRLTPPRPE